MPIDTNCKHSNSCFLSLIEPWQENLTIFVFQSYFFVNGNSHANGYSKGELQLLPTASPPPAHIVKMEELTGGGSVKSLMMDSSAASSQVTSSLLKIKTVLDDLKASIQAGNFFYF
uniref:Uncharacterized protein n=1 Tax=Caenorhabditis japonica TaxID=281687 RepID=A0A8R1J044_CAEJA